MEAKSESLGYEDWTRAEAIPISTYNTDQTGANRTEGGFQDGLTISTNQVLIWFPFEIPMSEPTMIGMIVRRMRGNQVRKRRRTEERLESWPCSSTTTESLLVI